MSLKPVFLSILLITTLGNFGSAKPLKRSSQAMNSAFWSVIPASSIYDSLKVEIKRAPSGPGFNNFRDYLNALQFRDQMQQSDNLHHIFPTSAGVYNGSLNKDSLSAFDQLLFLYRNLGDRNAEAGVLNSYAINLAVKGNMDQALLLFDEALNIYIQANNMPAIAKNYLNLARINRFRGNFSEAIKYNNAIVDISSDSPNNPSLAEAYINLANLWTAQKNYTEAESMIIKKALPLYYYKLKDKVGTIKCYDQLAEMYQLQKRFSEAKWFYIQSNMMARKINNSYGIVNSLINLAHVKMSIGDYQLALRDIREAEQLSVKNKYGHKLVEIKNDLSEIYTKLGDKGAANSALSEFTALKDALLSTAQ